MREHFPPAEPPATMPPAATDEAAPEASAGFTGPDPASPAAAGHPGLAAQHGSDGDATLAPARLRQAIVWFFVAFAAVVAGIAATLFIRDLRSTQALHAVARVAAVPATGQGTPSAGMQQQSPAAIVPPLPNTVQPAAGAAPMAPAVANAAIPAVPGSASGSGAKEVTAAMADSGKLASSGRMPGDAATGTRAKRGESEAGRTAANPGGAGAQVARQEPLDGAAPATSDSASAGAIKSERAQAGEREGRSKAKARTSSTERRAAARRAERSTGTFKRCPPLGKKGAVMCRWHICNGGAGKEPACRPYLERRP